MMLLRLAAAAACCMVMPVAAAWAGSPDDANGRYTMSPVDGGFMRLDKETGAVALCARTSGQWLCEPIEDRSKPSADLSKLEAENQVLKDRVKSLEQSLETGTPPNGPPVGKPQLPTEEEVDKALDYMERMFKKFRDRLQKLEPAPGSPTPPADGKGTGAL